MRRPPVTEAPRSLGVVFGGASVEHTISIRSARAVMAAANAERWRMVPFAVSRTGLWLTPEESSRALSVMQEGGPEEIADPAAPRTTRIPQSTLAVLAQCDAVFPLIHGTSGEDGVLQGFIETLDLPYVGSGVAASALAMDKARCKRLLRDVGIPVAPDIVVSCDDWRSDPTAVARRAAEVGYPYFVKPSRGGSSIGAGRVDSREEAADALAAAFAYDSDVLIEEAMPSPREIECGVLGSSGGRPPIVSPPGEIRTQRPFYDYIAKYEDPATELIAPARLDAKLAEQLQRAALEAWSAVGAEGMVRADFLVADDGRFWLGELNTIPGFTSASMYPRVFEAAGIPLSDLIDRLVDLAIERRRNRADGPTAADREALL
ncbi:MAG: D-alanine--D-alanine ligase [Chloroflexi bacterium]|nr:D-alanine--D-alanine ligase [Chloroflexota bacterium]MYF80226.1 D-alanine--D-alanine ligase [Chloroflexota bacterium]MYI03759.1 D-alanine--D-alanine ligase [Chloroflexota bacterium]